MISEDGLRQSFIEQFDKYDSDRSGNLDLKELTLFFKDVLERRRDKGKDPEVLAKQFIMLVDRNRDGKVSRQ